MSVYLQEVQVIATTASGSCEMAVEVSVGDVLHGALPLGSAVSGDCRYGQLSAEPNTLALASISPADVVLQIAYDVAGAVWVPASLFVVGRGTDGSSRLLAAIPAWPAGVGLTELGEDGRVAVSSGQDYFIVTAQAVLALAGRKPLPPTPG